MEKINLPLQNCMIFAKVVLTLLTKELQNTQHPSGLSNVESFEFCCSIGRGLVLPHMLQRKCLPGIQTRLRRQIDFFISQGSEEEEIDHAENNLEVKVQVLREGVPSV